MLPADQRFHCGGLTGIGAYFRLIVQRELDLLDRFANTGLKRQRLKRFLVQAWLEELPVVAPAFLRQIHRRIGIANERIWRLAISWKDTDADRRGNGQHLIFERKRLADGLGNFFSDRRDVLGVGECVKYHEKFIATETTHQIDSAQARLQPRCDFLQQFITRVMPQRVVDGFEIIEIDKHDPDFRLIAPRTRENVLYAVQKQRTVGKMRQGIVMSQKLNARLGLLPVADVAYHGHAMSDAGINKILADQLHGQLAAIVANQGDFVRPFKPRAYVARHRFEIFGCDEILIATTDQLRVRQPHHPGRGFVAVDDDAGVNKHDALVGRVGKFSKPFFAVADCSFRLMVAGDVVDEHIRRLRRARVVKMRNQGHFKCAFTAVGQTILALIADSLAEQGALHIRLNGDKCFRTDDFGHGLADDGLLIQPEIDCVCLVRKLAAEIIANKIGDQRWDAVREQPQQLCRLGGVGGFFGRGER